jgi:tripartite-type tricarboxylate transporter receptor subunit TctC
MPFTRRAGLAACLALGAAFAATAAETAYPTKPIRVIVPFAAGSTTDIIARAITDKMSASLGQMLVIDNRGGASGTIGQQAVATAAPDGYTIMIHSSSHTVSPSTFAKLPFDTVADFAGVTPISTLPNALVISPAKNIKTLKELVAAAKAKPGTINFASAGQGSATHLNAEKFKLAAKMDATNIPFKGSADAVTEVLSGRVDYYFSPIAPVIGQIREGHLLALAVGSPKRAAALPEVPTTAEAGVPGSEFNFWIGMMAPAKTPRAVVNRLHDEVAKALASPEVKERFLKLGADAWTLKPEQFDAYIKDEIASNATLVKAAGLSPAPYANFQRRTPWHNNDSESSCTASPDAWA